jgi:hypothetical protein
LLFGEKKISVFLKLGQNRTVAEEYHLGEPLPALGVLLREQVTGSQQPLCGASSRLHGGEAKGSGGGPMASASHLHGGHFRMWSRTREGKQRS